MATIQTVYDHKRGCGFRKPGGLYLMSGAYFKECGKLPIELTVCPCCGEGIKPARSWTWVQPELIKDAPCKAEKASCETCVPMGDKHLSQIDQFGLLWIGEKHYKRPEDFIREANGQGISRRIKFVPKNFHLETTWVLLAHRKAIYEPAHDLADEEDFVPGIFMVFKPERIEYVVTGEETEEELDRMEKRGLTLVRIELAEEQTELPTE